MHPGDLKNGVAEFLNGLLEPIRKEFEAKEMQELILNAYPPPAPVQQKKSKKFKYFENIFIFDLKKNHQDKKDNDQQQLCLN